MKTTITLFVVTAALAGSVYALDAAVGTQTGISTNTGSTQTKPVNADVRARTAVQMNTNASTQTTTNGPAAGAITNTNGTLNSNTNYQQNSTDMQLSTRVQQELQSQIKGYSANRQMVMSQNGEVTLQGTVSSRAEADRIERTAKRVRGVRKVTNNLTIEADASGTN